MKTNILLRPATLTLLAGLSAWPLALRAADDAAPAGQKPAAVERHEAMRARLEESARELGLTEAQKEQLTPIFKAQLQRLAELRQDTGLAPREKLQRLRSVHEEFAPQVKAILTPEQYAQWEKKQQENRERLFQRLRERRPSS